MKWHLWWQQLSILLNLIILLGREAIVTNGGGDDQHDAAEEGYMGCWIDPDFTAMEFYSGNEYSINACIDYCGANGYSFAGLQYSNHCFCGNQYTSFGQASSDKDDCHLDCHVGEGKCGGLGFLSVWSVVVSSSPDPPPPPTTTTTTTTASNNNTEDAANFIDPKYYRGCWNDPDFKAMEFYSGNEYSIQKCRNHCRANGYSFAGLQYSNHCFCGNHYSSFGQATSEEKSCFLKCHVGEGICGGFGYLSVWSVGVWSVTPRPTTPSPTTPGATNKPTVQPTVIPILKPTPLPTDLPSTTAPSSPQPTALPTELPSAAPTPEPTALPTELPSANPSPEPTDLPTELPSAAPSPQPTPCPTAHPSNDPTLAPTPSPTTGSPTPNPTRIPTPVPSPPPTAPAVTPMPTTTTPMPTPNPSPPPLPNPTPSPTPLPSPNPTPVPTPLPSPLPTPVPTRSPSDAPTTRAPPTAKPTTVIVTIDGIRYRGCYVDATPIRAMEYSAGNGFGVTQCIHHCKDLNYPFAGLQFFDQCYCGNTYDRYGSAPERECNTNCKFSVGMCGGPWRMSVWTTGVKTTTPTPGPTPSPTRGPATSFNIDLDLQGVTKTFEFQNAVETWGKVIKGDLPDVTQRLPGQSACGGWPSFVDDLYICGRYQPMDGPGGILGAAGPRYYRIKAGLPITGEMRFDIADVGKDWLNLLGVIMHEMGHVLGIGTLWQAKGLTPGRKVPCPYALNSEATREFHTISGCWGAIPVEQSYQGGGSNCGHWQERCFKTELMTPAASGDLPLSRITIAGLADLGYEVDYSQAAPFNASDIHPDCVCDKGLLLRGQQGGGGGRRKRKLVPEEDSTMITSIKVGGRRDDNGDVVDPPIRPRPRHRRLSDEGRAMAMDYGRMILFHNRWDALRLSPPPEGIDDLGQEVTYVLFIEDETIHSVMVTMDDL